MPLILPGAVTAPLGDLGILACNPAAVSTGYVWGYTQESKTLPAYTPAVLGSPFLGGLLDLLSAARLADLNTVRVAVENQRAFTEGIAKQHNQLCADLVRAGIIGV